MTWSDEPVRYSREYHRNRALVRKRAQGRCEVYEGQVRCRNPISAVDHIRNRASGGTDDLSNLQAICKQHHDIKTQIEALEGKAKKSTKRPPREHPGRAAARQMRNSEDDTP